MATDIKYTMNHECLQTPPAIAIHDVLSTWSKMSKNVNALRQTHLRAREWALRPENIPGICLTPRAIETLTTKHRISPNRLCLLGFLPRLYRIGLITPGRQPSAGRPDL